ncbi:SpoIIE family protein phosphatase [Streptomyces antibioticus]|uniref:SpoIIE family protein phosphatase n=1 Tax=Streptomyces antibioticus TaxID=1890 RepID=UPI0036DB0BDA
MDDVRCGWCDAPLPDDAARNRRYCGPLHRQAAWRARRRWRAAADARRATLLTGTDLLDRAQAVATRAVDPSPAHDSDAGRLCAEAAEVPDLADQLVRNAVQADRQAGATWAQIGAGLGIGGEAARNRYGRGRAAVATTPLPGTDPVPAPEEQSGHVLEALRPCLVEVVRETGASAGLLYLVSLDGRVLRLAATSGVPPKIAALWERLRVAASGPVADAVRERRLVWLASQAELTRRYPKAALVLPYDVALAAAPLVAGPMVRGALVLLWPGSRPPRLGAHERRAVGAARDRMSALLERAAEDGQPVLPGRAPRHVAPARGPTAGPAEAQAAADFANRLPEGCCALDPEGRITFVNAAAAELVGRRVAELAGALLWEALPWLDDPAFEDRYRAAVLSHRPTSFTALCPPDRRLDLRLCPDGSGVSLRITPVGIAATADTVDRPGSEHQGTGGLYDLMHLAATLTEAASVRDVVELAADHIMPAFDAQGFVLSLAEGGRLRVVGHRGYRPEVIEFLDLPPFKDATAPTVRALTTGAPLFFASPREMARLNPAIPRLTGRGSWAFLPLIASGRPVGCCVVSYQRPHTFAPGERAVLTSLAGLIAQAVDRARLYDAKHQLAHSLQTGLLPATLPTVPGLRVAARYLPGARDMDIGGDFYDVIRCGGAGVAAAIGDVQGHNVNAAALMGQVRTAVHATAGAPPAEVLARTNRLLTDLDSGLFTSCVYAHLDLAGRTVRLATAGHPPPLLRRPDGRTEILDLPPGLLLGIDPGAEYEATEIPLPPGAVLALYTDGLIEAPGVDLGDATAVLAGHLAREDPRDLDAMADALLQRSPSCGDDVALLLLHPPPPP